MMFANILAQKKLILRSLSEILETIKEIVKENVVNLLCKSWE